jgi:hypothetical protein
VVDRSRRLASHHRLAASLGCKQTQMELIWWQSNTLKTDSLVIMGDMIHDYDSEAGCANVVNF